MQWPLIYVIFFLPVTLWNILGVHKMPVDPPAEEMLLQELGKETKYLAVNQSAN